MREISIFSAHQRHWLASNNLSLKKSNFNLIFANIMHALLFSFVNLFHLIFENFALKKISLQMSLVRKIICIYIDCQLFLFPRKIEKLGSTKVK